MKRILLFVITAALCLSLFACTSSQQSETTDGTVKEETEETEEREEIITTAEPDTTAPDTTTAPVGDTTTMGEETAVDVTAAETTAVEITVAETTVAETAAETTVAETKRVEETYTYITTKKVEYTTSPSDTESPEETEPAEVSLSSCLAELGVRTSANASLVAYKQIAENNVDVIVIVNRNTDALLTIYKYDGTKLSEVSSTATNKVASPSQNPYIFVFGYTLWEG